MSAAPQPAAGSEELRQKIQVAIFGGVEDKPCALFPEDEDLPKIMDNVMHLITAQNDATYAKVMEEIEHAETITDLRQSIAKIFGKADAKPAGEGGVG